MTPAAAVLETYKATKDWELAFLAGSEAVAVRKPEPQTLPNSWFEAGGDPIPF